MRGGDERSCQLFSYVDLEDRVPLGHPLRAMRDLVNPALAALDDRFAALYKETGRPSIAPERLLRAILLQILYSIRSERQLMERLDFDLLFRWFVGLGVDDPVWDASPIIIFPKCPRWIESKCAVSRLRPRQTGTMRWPKCSSTVRCPRRRPLPQCRLRRVKYHGASQQQAGALTGNILRCMGIFPIFRQRRKR